VTMIEHTAFGEAVDPATADRAVEVDALDTMAFEPGTIEVAVGEAITFVVTNRGEAVHEFTLGDEEAQRAHADEMAEGGAHDDEHAVGGAVGNTITLQPGETKELAWWFDHAGTVEYACHVPGHYEAGMHGQITVG
jgi:uncharacterized cupredoxin-like copper-binding protein